MGILNHLDLLAGFRDSRDFATPSARSRGPDLWKIILLRPFLARRAKDGSTSAKPLKITGIAAANAGRFLDAFNHIFGEFEPAWQDFLRQVDGILES